MKIHKTLISGFILLLTVCCVNESDLIHKQEISELFALDYSNENYWISYGNAETKNFDVIFIHPTTYFDTVPCNDNLSIDSVNSQTQNSIKRQASAFDTCCNVYAPYFRQMSMGCINAPSEIVASFLNLAYCDVEAALNYYLDSLNNGRPYIIAGHSQGSKLIKEYLYRNANSLNKELLVAVYAIGYTFTQDTIDVIGIELSENETQTPALITWNTISKGGISPVINEGAKCVNPLSWNTNTDSVSAVYNKGAHIQVKDEAGAVKFLYINNFTSAQIDETGALVIPYPSDSIMNLLDMSMGDSVFHSYDYDFFYENIVDNVVKRCNAYQLNK